MSKLLSKLSKVSRSLSRGESLLELELVLGTGVSVIKRLKYFILQIFFHLTFPLLRGRGGRMIPLLQTPPLLLTAPPEGVRGLPQVDVLPGCFLLAVPQSLELTDRPLLQTSHRVPQLSLVNLLDSPLDQDQSPDSCKINPRSEIVVN